MKIAFILLIAAAVYFLLASFKKLSSQRAKQVLGKFKGRKLSGRGLPPVIASSRIVADLLTKDGS